MISSAIEIRTTGEGSTASWFHPKFGHLVTTGDGSIDRAIGQLSSIRSQFLASALMVQILSDWEKSGVVTQAEANKAVDALSSDIAVAVMRAEKGLQLLPQLDGKGYQIQERAEGWVALFKHDELGTLESNCHSSAESLVQEAIQISHRLNEIDGRFNAMDFLLDQGFISEDEFEADTELLFVEIEELCARWRRGY